MFFLFVSFCVLLLAAPPAAASYSWEWTGGPHGAVVSSMAVTPLGTILVGTDNGGLYRSTDGGATWSLPDAEPAWPCCNYGIPSLAAGESALYAGTWGGGAFRSDDDGLTWYGLGAIPNEGYPIVLGLAACRFGERVYAGGQFGVVRSDDGGASWTAVSEGLPAGWVRALALRGIDLFARTDQGVYRLESGAGTWSAWNDGLPATTGMQSISATADALFLSTHEGGVFHLDCGDGEWVAMNSGLYDDNVDAVVEVDRILYAGLMGGGVWRWDPAFSTWGEMNSGLWNKDVRVMERRGLSPLAGTWGAGVFQLDPATDTWTAQSSGMASPFVTALVTDGSDVYAGTEGGGVFVSSDQGENWVRSISGLADVSVWTLARDAGGVYAGTWIGVYKSTDRGQSWSAAGLQSDGVFSMGYWAPKLFAGTFGGRVWSSTDGGQSWSEVGAGLPSSNVQCLARVGSVLYAALWGQGVYALPDGGTTWTAMNTGLPDLLMRSMTAHAGSLFLGTESQGVWKWDAAAGSWNPSGPANTTVWSLASTGNELLAGTWGGFFASTDTGGTWTDEHGALKPWSAVRAIAPGTQHLFAGLMGSGVWRAPIDVSAVDGGMAPAPEAAAAGFTAHPNPFASGMRVEFTLARPEPVRLAVYDSEGRIVARLVSAVLPAGRHEQAWNGVTTRGTLAAPGVYLLRLEVDGREMTKKTVRMR